MWCSYHSIHTLNADSTPGNRQPSDLGYESACRLLPFTPFVTVAEQIAIDNVTDEDVCNTASCVGVFLNRV